MVLVDLNYLPPSARVAVFMSAAPGRPPPRPVVYRGTRFVEERSFAADLYHRCGQLTRLAGADICFNCKINSLESFEQ